MTASALASKEIAAGKLEPMAVGRYPHRDGEMHLLPYSIAEFERLVQSYQFRLGTFHFRSGDQILICSLFDESAQFAALERSLRDFGLVQLNSDSSFFDAGRTESHMRRFDVAAVCGVNAAMLDGLVAMGHDQNKVFANRVVWARPDAQQRLQSVPGINLRLWTEVGPAVAMQCAHGEGAHINRLEWHVETIGGEIVLSSRLDRSLDFDRYRTGVRAQLVTSACRCGSADPRVVLNA